MGKCGECKHADIDYQEYAYFCNNKESEYYLNQIAYDDECDQFSKFEED